MDNEYRQLHPDEVEQVHVLHDTDHLEKLTKEYNKLQRSTEDLIDDFTSKKRRNKKIKPKMVRSFATPEESESCGARLLHLTLL